MHYTLSNSTFSAERQNCLSENGCYLKDKLYSEFYGFLSELHGPMKASTRLIKLLALQVDAKVNSFKNKCI